MNNLAEIRIIVARVSDLLAEAGNQNWLSAFQKFSMELNDHPARAIAQIISVYGGMGSFNDIVLYEDGQPNTAWNVELDALREALYRLCRSQI